MLHIICNTIAWLLLLSLSNVTAGWDYWLLFFASSMHLSDKIINYSYWYNNLLTRLIDFIHIPQIYQLLNSQNAFLFLCVCVVFETWSYVSSVDPRLPLYPRLRSSSSCLHFLSAEYTPVLPHLLRMILSALYQLSIFKKNTLTKSYMNMKTFWSFSCNIAFFHAPLSPTEIFFFLPNSLLISHHFLWLFEFNYVWFYEHEWG